MINPSERRSQNDWVVDVTRPLPQEREASVAAAGTGTKGFIRRDALKLVMDVLRG